MQIDFLAFDRSSQPFNKDIVSPVVLAVYTDAISDILQNLREVQRGGLTALIGVEDSRFPVPGESLFNGYDAEVCFQRDGETPGRDVTAESVN